MISHATDCTIRALTALARFDRSGWVLSREISEASGVPHTYLSKIFVELRRRGLVVSGRGPGGGFKLGRPAQDISLYSMVTVFEDFDHQRACFLGSRYCDRSDLCSVGARWQEIWDRYEYFLRESTLDHLAFHDSCQPRTPADEKS